MIRGPAADALYLERELIILIPNYSYSREPERPFPLMLYNVYIVPKKKSPILIVLRREEYPVSHYLFVVSTCSTLRHIHKIGSPTQYSRKSYISSFLFPRKKIGDPRVV